jgi:hypothetical protein
MGMYSGPGLPLCALRDLASLRCGSPSGSAKGQSFSLRTHENPIEWRFVVFVTSWFIFLRVPWRRWIPAFARTKCRAIPDFQTPDFGLGTHEGVHHRVTGTLHAAPAQFSRLRTTPQCNTRSTSVRRTPPMTNDSEQVSYTRHHAPNGSARGDHPPCTPLNRQNGKRVHPPNHFGLRTPSVSLHSAQPQAGLYLREDLRKNPQSAIQNPQLEHPLESAKKKRGCTPPPPRRNRRPEVGGGSALRSKFVSGAVSRGVGALLRSRCKANAYPFSPTKIRSSMYIVVAPHVLTHYLYAS